MLSSAPSRLANWTGLPLKNPPFCSVGAKTRNRKRKNSSLTRGTHQGSSPPFNTRASFWQQEFSNCPCLYPISAAWSEGRGADPEDERTHRVGAQAGDRAHAPRRRRLQGEAAREAADPARTVAPTRAHPQQVQAAEPQCQLPGAA